MDVNQFIQNVISGNAVEAKESLNDILSSRAFTSLDEYKKEIAQKLYATEEDVEVQDTADFEIEEDDLLTQEEFDSLSEEDQQMYLEALEQLDEKIKVGHQVSIHYPGTAAHGKKGVVGEIKDGQAKVHIGGALGVQKHMKFDSGAFAKPGTKVPVGKGGKGISVGGTTTHVPVSALKRVDEETEQLDEIGDTPKGKKMLGSYLKKRTKQIPGIERNYQMTPYEDGPMGAKTIKKFQKKVNKGMGRAIDRLTKEEAEQIDEKISPYDWDGHRQSMNHHNEYAETGSKPHLKDKHIEAAKAHKAAADAIKKNRPDAEELSKKAKSMSKELAKNYSYTHDDRHN